MNNLWLHDDQAMAHLALACLDLTELGEGCTTDDIDALCAKAQGQLSADVPGHVLGSLRMPAVAAVCVWPAFVAQARAALPDSIRVAAVVNFPGGEQTLDAVCAQVQQIREGGGQEVDGVLPYRAWMMGHSEHARAMVRTMRQASAGLTLKLILESGAFNDDALLRAACDMALDEGVDFLKTSTGKIPQGASVDAAHVLLSAMAAHPAMNRLGFKPSGGIRTVDDVRAYAQSVQKHLGPHALGPQRFRIGASGLWSDMVRILGASGAASSTHVTY